MADAETPQPTMRAGFWRRALAILIDLALITLIVTVAGVLLFGLTDGRVRISVALIDVTRCSNVDPQRLVLANPPPFHITDARRCTKSFLGLVHDRTLQVDEVTRSGTITYRRGMTYPVDADGRVVQASYIDTLIFVLFVGYVLWLEWRFGQTLGKRIMHIRVQSLGGGPIDFAQAVKRSVIRFLPWPVLLLPIVLLSAFGANVFFAFVPGAVLWILALVAIVAALIYAVNFVQTTRRRELPWHDRWAATEVVRD
jgi:uncharacterized RDD family membrane protein YckC